MFPPAKRGGDKRRSAVWTLNEGAEQTKVSVVIERGGNDVSAKARKKGLEVAIHGWIDDLRDGLIQDLDVRVENAEQMRHLKRNFWNVKAN